MCALGRVPRPPPNSAVAEARCAPYSTKYRSSQGVRLWPLWFERRCGESGRCARSILDTSESRTTPGHGVDTQRAPRVGRARVRSPRYRVRVHERLDVGVPRLRCPRSRVGSSHLRLREGKNERTIVAVRLSIVDKLGSGLSPTERSNALLTRSFLTGNTSRSPSPYHRWCARRAFHWDATQRRCAPTPYPRPRSGFLQLSSGSRSLSPRPNGRRTREICASCVGPWYMRPCCVTGHSQ